MNASRRTSLAIGSGLTVITLVVFGQVAWFDFTDFDDPAYVTNFPLVKGGLTIPGIKTAFTTLHGCNWHPLTWLSLMTDWHFFGKSGGAFHLHNLGLHLANTLLLFAALLHMTAQPWRSGLVAALFAIHPLHVESVAWVCERKDVLSTFFWMLVLWSYSRYARRRAIRWYVVVFVSMALGLMAKPMLVTLPCVLLLLDFWPLQRRQRKETNRASPAENEPRRAARRQPAGHPQPQSDPPTTITNSPTSLSLLIVEKLPLFALVAASCVVTLIAQKNAMAPLTNIPLATRLCNAVMAYATYLRQTIWPVGLTCFYPYITPTWASPGPIIAALLLAAITLLAVRWRKQQPWLLVGWLWYLGTLVPVIGIVQVGSQAMADRYTYVPLIGVFLMAAWSIPARWESRRGLVVATATMAIAGLMVVTWKQARYWRNSFALFEHALAVTERNFMAHLNLGIAYQKQGNLDMAFRHLYESIRLMPTGAQAHSILADIYARRGELEPALAHAKEAVRNDPNQPEAQGVLGLCLAREGKHAEAVKHFRVTVDLVRDNPYYRFNLANALADSGAVAEAIDEYRTVIQMRPGFADAHFQVGSLYAKTGKTSLAAEEFRRALQYKPEHSQAREALENLEGAKPP